MPDENELDPERELAILNNFLGSESYNYCRAYQLRQMRQWDQRLVGERTEQRDYAAGRVASYREIINFVEFRIRQLKQKLETRKRNL